MAGLALVVVLLLSLAAAQNPVVKIGATLSRCGSSSDLIIRVDASLHWWANYTTTHGGIIINGTVHDVQFISYNDASDPDLVALLYERLVTVDKVDALLSPYISARSAFAIAQQYNIPIFNIGDFAYAQAPDNGSYGGWVFTAIPNPVLAAQECYKLLHSKGSRTLSSAWTTDVTTSSFDLISLLTAGSTGLTVIPPTLTVQKDLSNVDDVVAELKKEKADAFSDEESVGLLEAMYKHQYFPKATILWVGPGFESFRKLAGWRAGSVMFPDLWNPSLNYTDAQFGSSQGFYDTFSAGVGRAPDLTDVIAMLAMTSLKLAFEDAGTTAPVAVRNALLQLNEETFFGIANYSSTPAQQTSAAYYCFQLDVTGLNVFPVSSNAPGYQDLIYPAVVNIPPGYFPPKSHLARNLGLGLGLGLGIPMLIALGIGFYTLFVRYQVVFIPKADNTADIAVAGRRRR